LEGLFPGEEFRDAFEAAEFPKTAACASSPLFLFIFEACCVAWLIEIVCVVMTSARAASFDSFLNDDISNARDEYRSESCPRINDEFPDIEGFVSFDDVVGFRSLYELFMSCPNRQNVVLQFSEMAGGRLPSFFVGTKPLT